MHPGEPSPTSPSRGTEVDAMTNSVAHADRPPGPPAFIPPLHIAREQARRILDEAPALDAEAGELRA